MNPFTLGSFRVATSLATLRGFRVFREIISKVVGNFEIFKVVAILVEGAAAILDAANFIDIGIASGRA